MRTSMPVAARTASISVTSRQKRSKLGSGGTNTQHTSSRCSTQSAVRTPGARPAGAAVSGRTVRAWRSASAASSTSRRGSGGSTTGSSIGGGGGAAPSAPSGRRRPMGLSPGMR